MIFSLAGIISAIITVIILVIFIVKMMISFIKKRPFPKKWFTAAWIGVIFAGSFLTYTEYFFTFKRIDKEYVQKGPGPLNSPSGDYTANAFYEPYGGAAGGVNVWVEITDHRNHDKKKIIYYGDANSSIDLVWKDKNKLFIKNEEPEYPKAAKSITLDVQKEIYHESGLACKSILMKDEFEKCYHD